MANEDKKYTPEQLGKALKEKYPGKYDNYSDSIIGEALAQKYPDSYGKLIDRSKKKEETHSTAYWPESDQHFQPSPEVTTPNTPQEETPEKKGFITRLKEKYLPKKKEEFKVLSPEEKQKILPEENKYSPAEQMTGANEFAPVSQEEIQKQAYTEAHTPEGRIIYDDLKNIVGNTPYEYFTNANAQKEIKGALMEKYGNISERAIDEIMQSFELNKKDDVFFENGYDRYYKNAEKKVDTKENIKNGQDKNIPKKPVDKNERESEIQNLAEQQINNDIQQELPNIFSEQEQKRNDLIQKTREELKNAKDDSWTTVYDNYIAKMKEMGYEDPEGWLNIETGYRNSGKLATPEDNAINTMIRQFQKTPQEELYRIVRKNFVIWKGLEKERNELVDAKQKLSKNIFEGGTLEAEVDPVAKQKWDASMAMIDKIDERLDAISGSGDHLSELNQAKNQFEAAARAYYLNESPEKYAGSDIIDLLKSAGKGFVEDMFGQRAAEKIVGSTEADLQRGLQKTSMVEGFRLSENEQKALQPTMAEEISPMAGGTVSFALKFYAANLATRGLGITKALEAWKPASNIGRFLKFGAEGLVSEAQFEAMGSEPGTGFVFHGISSALGKIPLFKKYGKTEMPWYKQIPTELLKSDLSLTTTSNLTDAVHAVSQSMFNNKDFQYEIDKRYGPDFPSRARKIMADLSVNWLFGISTLINKGVADRNQTISNLEWLKGELGRYYEAHESIRTGEKYTKPKYEADINEIDNALKSLHKIKDPLVIGKQLKVSLKEAKNIRDKGDMIIRMEKLAKTNQELGLENEAKETLSIIDLYNSGKINESEFMDKAKSHIDRMQETVKGLYFTKEPEGEKPKEEPKTEDKPAEEKPKEIAPEIGKEEKPKEGEKPKEEPKPEEKPAEEKQPWQMTKSEYTGGRYLTEDEISRLTSTKPKGMEGWSYELDGKPVDKTIKGEYKFRGKISDSVEHKKAVESALKEGKSVPEEVLNDYPDLKEKYAEKPIPKEEPKPEEKPEKYYSSHGRLVPFSEIRKVEVDERENYDRAIFDEWQKKYNIKDDDQVLWVTPSKKVALTYMEEAEMHDEIMKMTDDQVEKYLEEKGYTPEEIDAKTGYIIPESDDGDMGFLFVNKPAEEKPKEKPTGEKKHLPYQQEYDRVKSRLAEKESIILNEYKTTSGTVIEYRFDKDDKNKVRSITVFNEGGSIVGIAGEKIEEKQSKEKQPWQMSRDEYVSKRSEEIIENTDNYYKSDNLKWKKQIREDAENKALNEWVQANEKAFIEGKNVKWKPNWSMTAKEVAERSDDTLDSFIKEAHKKEVKQAISEGKPVPEEVLKDYPDLKIKAQTSKKVDAERLATIIHDAIAEPFKKLKESQEFLQKAQDEFLKEKGITNSDLDKLSESEINKLKEDANVWLKEKYAEKLSGKNDSDKIPDLPKKEQDYLNKMMPTLIKDLENGRDFTAALGSIRSGILVDEMPSYLKFYREKGIIDENRNYISQGEKEGYDKDVYDNFIEKNNDVFMYGTPNEQLLRRAAENLGLNENRLNKVLSHAKKIAKYEKSDIVKPEHVAEAIQYMYPTDITWPIVENAVTGEFPINLLRKQDVNIADDYDKQLINKFQQIIDNHSHLSPQMVLLLARYIKSSEFPVEHGPDQLKYLDEIIDATKTTTIDQLADNISKLLSKEKTEQKKRVEEKPSDEIFADDKNIPEVKPKNRSKRPQIKHKPFTPKQKDSFIKKNINKKIILPILTEVMVKDGKMISSDLENFVSVDTDLPDGMYRYVGKEWIKGIYETEDFPVVNDSGKKVATVKLKGLRPDIQSAVNKVVYDEYRPVLNGIHIYSDGEKLVIEGTDSYRATRNVIKQKSKPFDVIIPKKAIDLLLYNKYADDFTLEVHEDRTLIKTPDAEINTRNIDAKFPNVAGIIPKTTDTHLSMDLAKLKSALNEVLPFSNPANNMVVFTPDFKKGTMKIHGFNLDENLEKIVEIPFKGNRSPMRMIDEASAVTSIMVGEWGYSDNSIAVNGKYLLSLADDIEDDKITLHTDRSIQGGKINLFDSTPIEHDPNSTLNIKKEKENEQPKETVSESPTNEDVETAADKAETIENKAESSATDEERKALINEIDDLVIEINKWVSRLEKEYESGISIPENFDDFMKEKTGRFKTQLELSKEDLKASIENFSVEKDMLEESVKALGSEYSIAEEDVPKYDALKQKINVLDKKIIGLHADWAGKMKLWKENLRLHLAEKYIDYNMTDGELKEFANLVYFAISKADNEKRIIGEVIDQYAKLFKELPVLPENEKLQPIELESGKVIKPEPDVKTNINVAISDVYDGFPYDYKGISKIAAKYLYSNWSEADQEYLILDEPTFDKKMIVQLEKGEMIEEGEGSYTYVLTGKGKNFIDRVNARIDTRKTVREGTNLFPDYGDIKELGKPKKIKASDVKIGDIIAHDQGKGMLNIGKIVDSIEEAEDGYLIFRGRGGALKAKKNKEVILYRRLGDKNYSGIETGEFHVKSETKKEQIKETPEKTPKKSGLVTKGDGKYLVIGDYYFKNSDLKDGVNYIKEGNYLYEDKPENRGSIKGQEYSGNGSVYDAINLINRINETKKPDRSSQTQLLDLALNDLKIPINEYKDKIGSDFQIKGELVNRMEGFKTRLREKVKAIPKLNKAITDEIIKKWFYDDIVIQLKKQAEKNEDLNDIGIYVHDKTVEDALNNYSGLTEKDELKSAMQVRMDLSNKRVVPEELIKKYADQIKPFTWMDFIPYNKTKEIPENLQKMSKKELESFIKSQEDYLNRFYGSDLTKKRIKREEISKAKRLMEAHIDASSANEKIDKYRSKPEKIIDYDIEDINKETATRAFNNTSHDPEKRGEAARKGYVSIIENIIDELLPYAETEKQKELLKDELESFRQRLIVKYTDWLHAESRTASSFITGPANFPVKQQEKRRATAEKKSAEIYDMAEKATRAIKKKLRAVMSPDQANNEIVKKLTDRIDESVETIKGIDDGIEHYSRTLFVNNLAGVISRAMAQYTYPAIKPAIDHLIEVNNSLEKPVFTKRHGIWKAIEEFKNQKEPDGKEGPDVEEIGFYGDATVENHKVDERIRVFFDSGKPATELINALKSEGWKWSPSNQAWQRKNTPNAIASIKRILSNFYGRDDVEQNSSRPEDFTEERSESEDQDKGWSDQHLDEFPNESGMHRVEFPELVRLVTKLIEKYPIIRNMSSLGSFVSGKKLDTGEKYQYIRLNRALYNLIKDNPNDPLEEPRVNIPLLEKVLAHEIGHLIDYLPDKTRRKGNILAHISAAKENYSKSLLGKSPENPEIITDEERDQLRKEAKSQLEAESQKEETEIIKEIVEEIPIYDETGLTVDDVLAIWRDVNARAKFPDLYSYISMLNKGQKKAIVKKAMKGILDDELAKKFQKRQIGVEKRTRTERVKVKPSEVTKSAIRKRFRELLIKEIKKRGLFQAEEITNELKDLTKWWNPFNEHINKNYTKYRHQPNELWAEAMSVLLNNPDALKEKAPNFWNAFFAWFDVRKNSQDAWHELQELADDPNVKNTDRLNRMNEGFAKGLEIRAKAANTKMKEQLSVWDKFLKAIISENIPVYKKLDDQEIRENDLTLAQTARNGLEQMRMTNERVAAFMTDMEFKVIKPLNDAGIDLNDWGAMLAFTWIMHGRKDKAAPYGFQDKFSEELLEKVKSKWTEEQQHVVAEATNTFHNESFKIVEEGYREGLFSGKLFKNTILPNKDNYVAFGVIDHIPEEYVFVTPISKPIRGTHGQIENPFFTTVAKMVAIMNLTDKQRAFNILRKAFWESDDTKDLIEVVPGTRFGKPRPKERGNAVEGFLVNGEVTYFEMPQYMADVFNYPALRNNGKLGRAIYLVISPWRWFRRMFNPLVTTWNPGWAFYSNLMRDHQRTLQNIITILGSHGKISKTKYLTMPFTEYSSAFFEAVSEAGYFLGAKRKMSEAITEMIKSGALFAGFYDRLDVKEGDLLEPILKANGLLKKRKSAMDWAEEVQGLNQLAWLLKQYERGVSVMEMSSKIAAYKVLRKYLGAEAAGFYTRNYAGTPNYRERGAMTEITNTISPFSNVIFQSIRTAGELSAKGKTAGSYWFLQIMRSALSGLIHGLLPVLGSALGLGGYAALYSMIPEYDRYNYMCLVYGKDKYGKPYYIRLQLDEEAKLVWAVTQWMGQVAANGDTRGWSQMYRLGVGLTPSMSPMTAIFGNTAQFLTASTDNPPVDDWYGSNIIPEDEWKIGKYSILKRVKYGGPFMLKWVLTKSGYRPWLKIVWPNDIKRRTINDIPFNRIFKIGGGGEAEAYDYAVAFGKDSGSELERTIWLKRMTREVVKSHHGEEDSPKVRAKITSEVLKKYMDKYPIKALENMNMYNLRIRINAYQELGTYHRYTYVIDRLMRYRSNTEKLEILREYRRRHTSPNEFTDLLTYLMKNQMISNELMEKALMDYGKDLNSDLKELKKTGDETPDYTDQREKDLNNFESKGSI